MKRVTITLADVTLAVTIGIMLAVCAVAGWSA